MPDWLTIIVHSEPRTQAYSPQHLSLVVLTQGRPGKLVTCNYVHLDVGRTCGGGHIPRKLQVNMLPSTNHKHGP